MNIDHLVRDRKKIHEALKEVNNSLIALKPVKIYFPENYLNNELSMVSDIIKVIGVFGITLDDKYYAISDACAMIQTEPSSSNTVEINKVKYIEFSYDVGSKVITNLNLVKTGTLVYRLYVDMDSKGNVPWYINDEDLAFIFETADYHAGANLHADSSLIELLSTVMTRQAKNKFLFYRHQDPNDHTKPVEIGINSVAYQSSNTLAKVAGAYFSQGLTSALVNPSEGKPELLESLLRK